MLVDALVFLLEFPFVVLEPPDELGHAPRRRLALPLAPAAIPMVVLLPKPSSRSPLGIEITMEVDWFDGSLGTAPSQQTKAKTFDSTK